LPRLIDVHDVQLGAGLVAEIDGGPDSQGGIFRTVGRQQDLRREGTHLKLLVQSSS
jgi:hypothetical protein